MKGCVFCNSAGISDYGPGGQGFREMPFGDRLKRCNPTGIPPGCFIWSGMEDLNIRLPQSKCGTLTCLS